MQYREDKGNKLSILGMGCMRVPRSFAETEKIMLAAIEGGVNYFDTAYIYSGNEEVVGKALAKNHKREAIFLATKLPIMLCKSEENAEAEFNKFFNTSLERLQTDFIDYYLLHMLTSLEQWKTLKKRGIEEWIAGKKKEGKIRRMGFSFHGTREEFLKLLPEYPWDFCQIQYNYSNENYQAGKDGLQAAGKLGITVIIMEPLLGGRLGDKIPREAGRVFAATNSSLTPAAWGLRWLWNQSEVTCVLSGMSSLSQVQDNLAAASGASPLSEAETAVYAEVVEALKRAYKVPCTGCNYCMPCPAGVNIPGCFAAYNTIYAQGYILGMQQYITSTTPFSAKPGRLSQCIGCGKCETHCPQHIKIRAVLKQSAPRLEPLFIKAGLAVARKFLR